jgi:hypothetical protein
VANFDQRKWVLDKLNEIVYNCTKRHLAAWSARRVASMFFDNLSVDLQSGRRASVGSEACAAVTPVALITHLGWDVALRSSRGA